MNRRTFLERIAAGVVRENAHYWTVVEGMADLERLLAYWERYPKETANKPPGVRREKVNYATGSGIGGIGAARHCAGGEGAGANDD